MHYVKKVKEMGQDILDHSVILYKAKFVDAWVKSRTEVAETRRNKSMRLDNQRTKRKEHVKSIEENTVEKGSKYQ